MAYSGKFGYHVLKPILAPIFKLRYKPTIINKEAIPTYGPIIIAGNHMHVLDQCMVLIATKRYVKYMAKDEYFKGKLAWFFKFVGCIPVNRSIHDDTAKEAALSWLSKGEAIGIFPEGTRNKTKEKLLPLKFGTVSMAKKSNATIVPFGVSGDYSKKRKSNLTIKFGKPFKVGNKSLEEANEILTKEIKRLMD